MIYRRLLSLATVFALLVVPGYASAQDVLWDAPPNPDLSAFVDQDFGDFPDFSTYQVHHVENDGKYHLHTVTTYYTNFNDTWPVGSIIGALQVYPQDGNLPDNGDVPPQMLVQGELAFTANGFAFTADVTDLEINVEAGAYWIGLTPLLNFDPFGQEFHQGTDLWPKNSAGRNPGGGFGAGTEWFDVGQTFGGIDWGGAITITGKKIQDEVSCTVDLIAGGGNPNSAVVVGSVTTELNDDGTWTVTYATTGSWFLQETKFHAGSSLDDFPLTRRGNPKVGQFDYKADHDPLVQNFSFIVDAQDSDCVLFGAHAEVVNTDDGSEESAWGAGTRFSDAFPQDNNGRGNWAMYFQCGDCDP